MSARRGPSTHKRGDEFETPASADLNCRRTRSDSPHASGHNRGRKLDVIVVTKRDRLARSVHHLLAVAKELGALGSTLSCWIRPSTPRRRLLRLLFHVLASVAEFERDLIRERVVAGMRRAKAQGRHLGRPAVHRIDAAVVRAMLADGLSLRAVARKARYASVAGLPRRQQGCLRPVSQSPVTLALA